MMTNKHAVNQYRSVYLRSDMFRDDDDCIYTVHYVFVSVHEHNDVLVYQTHNDGRWAEGVYNFLSSMNQYALAEVASRLATIERQMGRPVN